MDYRAKRRNKYRYILNEDFNPDEAVSKYRLWGNAKITHCYWAVRITVPENMRIIYCDNGYIFAKDARTLKELDYDIIIKFNNEWRVCNQLKHMHPSKYIDYFKTHGKYYFSKTSGFLTKDELKKEYAMKARKKKEEGNKDV